MESYLCIFKNIALSIILVLSLQYCAYDDTQTTSLPDQEFYVADVAPGYQSTVSSGPDKKITLVFSMPVEPSTILPNTGNVSFIQDINGVATDLSHVLTISEISNVVTFHVNYALAMRADYTLNISNNVKSIGNGMNLRSPVLHQFNTGGGYTQGGVGNTVPGSPYILEYKLVRECISNGTGQQEVAYIEVKFNEVLMLPPKAQVKKTLSTQSWSAEQDMQAKEGDMSVMILNVDPPEYDLQGYKIRFSSTAVTDLEGLHMSSFESQGIYQVFGGCN
ncbi:Ig-like domain-containing protein [bacterium]|nr:Ig-like domain-containing protein [bacterium]